MSTIGQLERVTQNRVNDLFRDDLAYRELGNWSDRAVTSNVTMRQNVDLADFEFVQRNKERAAVELADAQSFLANKRTN